MTNSVFSGVAQRLIQGEMICEISSDTYYDWLSDEVNKQRMVDYLYNIDRTVAETSDGKGFYSAYLDCDTDGAQRAIKQQFNEVATDLETLVKWLKLAMASNIAGSPLSAGDILNESELLASIEQSPSQLESLSEIAKSRFVNSKATEGRGKLKAVLSRLKDVGYLVDVGRSGSQYRATAKWSWLYDVMAFIRAHEALPEESDEPEQGRML